MSEVCFYPNDIGKYDAQLYLSDAKEKNATILRTPSSNQRQRRIYNNKHFNYEWIRRSTFDTWDVEFINKDKLAKAGFINLHHKDFVQCVFCKGVVGFWEKGDCPLKEHETYFPNCPLIKRQITPNVPIQSASENTVDDVLNRHLKSSLQLAKIPSIINTVETDSISTKNTKWVYSEYSSFENRMYSLQKWPKINVPSATQIANAGLFYTGISDLVYCYCCGGGLFNWNSDDSPDQDHKKIYPNCKEKKDDLRTYKQLSEQETEMLLQYPMSNTLIETGLSSNSIKFALTEYLELHTYLPSSFQIAIEAVLKWERKQNRRQSTNIQTKNNYQIQTEIEHHMTDAKMTDDQKERETDLKCRLKEEQDRYKCRRCQDGNIECVALPCQHFHLCQECANVSNQCYTCHKEVICFLLPIV